METSVRKKTVNTQPQMPFVLHAVRLEDEKVYYVASSTRDRKKWLDWECATLQGIALAPDKIIGYAKCSPHEDIFRSFARARLLPVNQLVIKLPLLVMEFRGPDSLQHPLSAAPVQTITTVLKSDVLERLSSI